jgi:hypothetical protein
LKIIPAKNEAKEPRGSSAHMPFADWSDKVVPGPTIETELDDDDSISKIYKTIDGNRYGFDDHVYPTFVKFTYILATLPIFSKHASHKFLLEETFDWIIESSRAGKIAFGLITHLQNRLDGEIETFTFHFPVLNLHIEKSFEIGKTKFQYFTKEYFDEYWNQILVKKQSKRDFDGLFNKYCGRVFISSTTQAESNKAMELAFHDASLAMDVLRFYSPAVAMPTRAFKVDLEKRININFRSDHLTETTKGGRQIKLSMSANNEPYFFNEELYIHAQSGGLILFSDFIKNKKSDKLYRLILHSITFYSFALTIPDFHLRISQIIMVIEGLLLEDGWVNGMQEKVKRRVRKLFTQEGTNDSLRINSTLSSMYKVRHAITHKGNRLYIDESKFRDLQIIAVETLKKVIILNQKFRSKEDLIKHIESLS